MRQPLANGGSSVVRSRRRLACLALQACALILSTAIGRPASAQQAPPPAQVIEKRFEAWQVEQNRARQGNLRLPTMAQPQTAGLDTRRVIKLNRIALEGAKAISAD